jgi:hypothetical protein
MSVDRITQLEGQIAALESLVLQRPIEGNELYTPAEVAAKLRCSKTNVYDLFNGGDLAVIKVGANNSGLRVKGSDLLSFVESRKEGGPQPKMAIRNPKLRR